MTRTLRTIGYEGATVEGFLAALTRAHVSVLLDIRAVAVSRRPGFSKTALREALAGAGIDYLHLRDLGDPKPGREAARAGRLAEFERIYRKHLASPLAMEALAEAEKLVARQAACLLCYEAEPNGCHRSIVAGALAGKTGLAVQHLQPIAIPGTTTTSARAGRPGGGIGSREGRSKAKQGLPGDGLLRGHHS